MLSFLSPCVLPLVPGYVSLLSGLSAAQLAERRRQDVYRVLRSTLGFVAGFTVVFTILGAAASELGRLLLHHQRVLEQVSGALVIVVGVFLIGLVSPRLLMAERRWHVRPSVLGSWAPPVMGMAFAFGWTPCIGPVLGGVLSLASDQATLAGGIGLLIFYSLGLGIPFIVAGLAFGRLTATLGRLKRGLGTVNLVSGAALCAFGVLLLTGNVSWISQRFSELLNWAGLNRLTVS